MKKSFLSLCVAVALGSVTMAHAQEDKEIRIGVINPLSGLSKDIGFAVKAGASLAAAEINARGGINGRKIVLVSYDDKGSPDHAVKVAEEAIKTGRLHAVLGSVNTGVAVKTMPLFQAAALPTMITSTIGSLPAVLTNDYKEPVNYIFRSQPPDYAQIEAIVRDLKQRDVKTVFLFADNTPFGESGKIQLEKELEKNGIKLLGVDRYKVGSKELESSAIKGRATKPEATLVWGLGFDQAALKIAMNRIGWRIPLYGSYTLAQQDYLNAVHSSANGTRIAMAFTVDSERPTAKHFMDNYYRYANTSRLSSPQSAAAGYDGMYLIGLAMQQANSLEGAKVVAALEDLQKPYYGIQKDFIKPFSKTNHEAFPDSKDVIIATTLDGNAWLKPEEVGTTLFNMKRTRSLTLGVRESSGLSYNRGDNKYVGFHTEMAERIAANLQKRYNLDRLDIKYQPVTTQNRITMVTNGTVDLECGSTTNTAGRQRDVAFAMTTYVEEVRIAVKASSPINSIKDLAGKQVVTTGNTTSVGTLKKYESVGFKTSYSKEHSESFSMLDSGKMDAFVMDASILASNISQSKNPSGFKIVGEVLSVEPIACMLRKDDPMFKAAVDDSIKAQIADGSLAKLYDKWFMQPIPPKNTKIGLPLSTATKAAWKKPNDNPVEAYAK